MAKEIESRALQINLAQTRDVEIIIPDEHQWFISLSKNYLGINKRAQEFFNEFHHPYSNRAVVVEQLPHLVIGDFWLYRNLPENHRAFEVILSVLDTLMAEQIPQELSRQVVYHALSYLEHLSGVQPYPVLVIKKGLLLLETHLDTNVFSCISNLGYMLKSLKLAGLTGETSVETERLVRRVALHNIRFWHDTTQIEAWATSNRKKICKNDAKALTDIGASWFEAMEVQLNQAEDWQHLVHSIIPFNDIAAAFRRFTSQFAQATARFNYLFYLLHLPGMVAQRDYLLWDLNKVIRNISTELTPEQIKLSMDELFALFAEFRMQYMGMVLDSVLTLGKEIINTKNLDLIHHFEDQLIELGFVTPGVVYLSNDWQLNVDRNHVKNIRVWLELIEHGPEMMKKLLSALIINLRLGGIFIFDTDLFQRDVTKLLNADISPIYKQIKQLTRIFPVYFNEIGAEGELRDVTTIIDELSQRNDKLIHFLRKQIHTEGNNTHIGITLEIIRFWYHPDLERLEPYVPGNVLETIDVSGVWVDGVHRLLKAMVDARPGELNAMLGMEESELQQLADATGHDHPQDVKRVLLLFKLYQLLKEKYSFDSEDIAQVLSKYRFFSADEIGELSEALETNRNAEALTLIFRFMVQLNGIIFDPEVSQGWESIYHKRHVAFGIPSMYGQYHETKFEALGLTFRLERVASLLTERLVAQINTDYITARTLKEVYAVIHLMYQGLELDGISDQGLSSNLEMYQYSLTSGSFTVKQYINIFQFMEDNVKEIINKYFIRPYEDLLKVIIPQLFTREMKPDARSTKTFIHRKAEIFYRELLFSTFLIQQLDNFIGSVLNNLRKMVTDLSTEDIRRIMSFDPAMVISPIHQETPAMDNQVFLGSKAYYLKKLYLHGYPVPPGFVLTTEVFRRKETIFKHPSLNADINLLIRQYIRELEVLSGKQYGNPQNPLLLSVRSGSAISMPGAMNTFLNVGMNDEITEQLSQEYNFGWTSWDCYRRLLQTWGMSHGLERNDFDQIMLEYKQKYNVSQKIDFPGHIMRDMAFTYKQLLIDHGIYFEADPFKQLMQAIISVFNSWETPRTNVYRSYMHIADEWGTAVIVQQMVFGNIHRESGSGVLFTHDPHETIPGIHLTGDFSFLSQGEDIVAGLVNTLPVSELQRQKYYQKSTFSLESAFPKIFGQLQAYARELIEEHGFSHQEIEFTFETADPADLYILQTRDISITRQEKRIIFATPQHKMDRVGCGIGIGNEVLNGLMAFDMDDLVAIRNHNPEAKALLVRPDTVPDDIEMIFECDGLLTGKGGATSHAAVTAATLGKICVVNCTDLLVNERQKTCTINGILFQPFDPIAIDGINGIIYKGHYPVKRI
jgi:pyruvate, orthophosphate dikinase